MIYNKHSVGKQIVITGGDNSSSLNDIDNQDIVLKSSIEEGINFRNKAREGLVENQNNNTTLHDDSIQQVLGFFNPNQSDITSFKNSDGESGNALSKLNDILNRCKSRGDKRAQRINQHYIMDA